MWGSQNDISVYGWYPPNYNVDSVNFCPFRFLVKGVDLKLVFQQTAHQKDHVTCAECLAMYL